jgi:hypothetical protein
VKNIQLLRETLEWIKAHPEEHYQGDWARLYNAKGEPCGTSMCFAGHATVLAGGTFDTKIFAKNEEWNVNSETGAHIDTTEYYVEEWDEYELPDNVVHVSVFARDALGLTQEEQSYLFAGHRTLEELEEFVNKSADGWSLVWARDSEGRYDYKYVKEEN